MKTCPYCKIEVGGNLNKCPFCQSRLSGSDDEEPYFPAPTILKLTSLFYKIQLFIVWTLIIGSLGADYLFGVKIYKNGNFHWSLLVLMWLIAFEFGIMRLFKKGFGSSRILTLFAFIVTVMLVVTSYYLGMLMFTLKWVCPIILAGVMIANFVLAMIDKTGNSMGYLILNFFIGVMPYIVLYIMGRDCPFAWSADLLLSIILFIGAVIFKGREVVSEIERRLNF
jgi:hypothetical protein